jgi:hypothetical protein
VLTLIASQTILATKKKKYTELILDSHTCSKTTCDVVFTIGNYEKDQNYNYFILFSNSQYKYVLNQGNLYVAAGSSSTIRRSIDLTKKQEYMVDGHDYSVHFWLNQEQLEALKQSLPTKVSIEVTKV